MVPDRVLFNANHVCSFKYTREITVIDERYTKTTLHLNITVTVIGYFNNYKEDNAVCDNSLILGAFTYNQCPSSVVINIHDTTSNC